MQAVIGMMHPSSRLSPLQGAMGFSVSLPVVDKRARIEGPIKHSDQGQSSTGEDTASHPVLLFSCSPSEAKLLVRPANGLLSQSLENGKEPKRTAGGSLWTAELR
ncbi:hypothetical protein FQN52_006195 [Onygenales sp. PD_12]|nr:hypothetical protein FQN52_006195 [Onygenales sp. PD_12]